MIHPVNPAIHAHHTAGHGPVHNYSLCTRIIYGIALAFITPILIFCAYKWLAHQWSIVKTPATPPIADPTPLSLDLITTNNALYMDGRNICLHPSIIKKDPEAVLKMIVDNDPDRVTYLDDSLQRAPGCDTGGMSRQLITELAKALLDRTDNRHIHFGSDEDLCPSVNEDYDRNKQLTAFQNLGKLFSYIQARPNRQVGEEDFRLSTGRILPDTFFAILKLAQNNPLDLHRQIGSLVSTLNLNEYGDDLIHEYEWFQGYVDMANAVISGLSPASLTNLNHQTVETFSQSIQGIPLDADDITQRFQHANINDHRALQKINHLKALIRNKLSAHDTAWVEKFLLAVTGSRAITVGTQIKFALADHYLAHTCSNTIDIVAADPLPRFTNFLEMLMVDPTAFTTA